MDDDRRDPFPGDDLFSEAAENFFTELGAQIENDADATPNVVLEETIDGIRVRIVDVTAAHGPDKPARRGFLWIAMGGTFELRAPDVIAGSDTLCSIIGGRRITQSPVSAADAMERARRVLRNPGGL